MGRYLLDTNIVVFLVLSELDEITIQNKQILDDYNNQLFTSSICVIEIIQLYRIGRIKTKKYKTVSEIIIALETNFNIKILPFAKSSVETLSKLQILENHKDIMDHSIISHAITENLFLMSSDKSFDFYTKQKLKFVFNKR